MKNIQIIHLIFFTLAPFYNAIMDTITHHFSISIFKNLNFKWWNANESFKYVKPFLGTRYDAWHVAKYGMLISFAVSIVTYTPIINYWKLYPILNSCSDVVIHVIYGGIIFELFYSYIFLINKNKNT